MRYCSSQAEWIYAPANINDTQLSVFSHELLKVCQITQIKIKTLFKNQYGPSFDINTWSENAPMLLSWLRDQSLSEYFLGGFFTVCDANTTMNIHVDSEKEENVEGAWIALLIPISNCKNSWTVWYDADHLGIPVIDEYANLQIYNSTVPPARKFNPDTATEITRVESIKPYWANVLIPHQVICGDLESPGPRMLASLRFRNGIFDDSKIKSYYMP